jgi:proteasome activator subunit 4
MFIVGAVQHVKIGDLSAHYGGVAFTGDTAEDRMDVDDDVDRMPEDLGDETILDRGEERSLTRDSTSGFAGEHDFSPLSGHVLLADKMT